MRCGEDDTKCEDAGSWSDPEKVIGEIVTSDCLQKFHTAESFRKALDKELKFSTISVVLDLHGVTDLVPAHHLFEFSKTSLGLSWVGGSQDTQTSVREEFKGIGCGLTK